jgi:hypothetical protein
MPRRTVREYPSERCGLCRFLGVPLRRERALRQMYGVPVRLVVGIAEKSEASGKPLRRGRNDLDVNCNAFYPVSNKAVHVRLLRLLTRRC